MYKRSMWIDFLTLIGILNPRMDYASRVDFAPSIVVPKYHFFRLILPTERQADRRDARKMEEIYQAI